MNKEKIQDFIEKGEKTLMRIYVIAESIAILALIAMVVFAMFHVPVMMEQNLVDFYPGFSFHPFAVLAVASPFFVGAITAQLVINIFRPFVSVFVYLLSALFALFKKQEETK